MGDTTPLTQSGSLTYTVTIDPSFTNVFDFAQTSINAAQLEGSFSKALSIPGLTPSIINPTQTGLFAPGTTTINATSLWTVTGNAFINQVSDQYTQNPVEPQPKAVPEPSTMLGAGVVLGALPVLKKKDAKRNKKKDGNA